MPFQFCHYYWITIFKFLFIFSAYRGKDSRFAMEQNVGPSVVGIQASGWLYNMTLNLSNEGVHLTYSGDSPFLMKLSLGNQVNIPRNFPPKYRYMWLIASICPHYAMDQRAYELMFPFPSVLKYPKQHWYTVKTSDVYALMRHI